MLRCGLRQENVGLRLLCDTTGRRARSMQADLVDGLPGREAPAAQRDQVHVQARSRFQDQVSRPVEDVKVVGSKDVHLHALRQASQMRSAFSLPGDQAACSVQLSAAPSTGSHAFCAMLPKPTTPMRNLVPTF